MTLIFKLKLLSVILNLDVYDEYCLIKSHKHTFTYTKINNMLLFNIKYVDSTFSIQWVRLNYKLYAWMFEHADRNNEIHLFSGRNQDGALFLKCTTFICTDLFTSSEYTL